MQDIIVDLKFPRTQKDPFRIKSPSTPNYNCIAWSVEKDNIWYWPDPTGMQYWPDDVPLEATVESFVKFYEKFGFERCEDGSYERKVIKVALFSKEGTPTHAARQLYKNIWTSKLGRSHDVLHTLDSMEDGKYGNVSLFMQKQIPVFKEAINKIKANK